MCKVQNSTNFSTSLYLVNVHFFPSPTAIPLHSFVVNTKARTEHPWSSWQLVTALGSQRVRQAFLFNLPSLSQWWSKYHLEYTSSNNKIPGSQAQPFLLSPLPWSQLLLGQGITALLPMDLPAQPSHTAKDRDLPLPCFLVTHGKQLRRWSCPFNVEEEPDSFYISCQMKWIIFIRAFGI